VPGDAIHRIEIIPVAVPFREPERSATLSRRGFDNVLVRLETEDGAVGWGEASGTSGAPVAAVRATLEHLVPFALGQSVFRTEGMRGRMLSLGRMANLRRLAHLAIAAVDTACGDAAGQIAGRPLHELLGGAVRDEIDFYGYPLAKAADDVAREARRFCEQGFTVIYLKVGLGDAEDEAVVRAVREGVGPGVRIRIDANEAWDVATARRMSVRLEPYGIDFLEQPIDARNLGAMRELRMTTRIPIAANQGIWSLAEAAAAIRAEACDIVVTGPPWVGGLVPLQRVAALCAESGVGFCRHAAPETSIGTVAGMHALATVPALLDGNQTYLYHLAEDVSDDLAPALRPRLPLPTGPGLGITVDESRVAALAERYRVDGPFAQNDRAPAMAP
jgi:L-alanine-DL-glutamate epimerase-like enolase superfamily enzyme